MRKLRILTHLLTFLSIALSAFPMNNLNIYNGLGGGSVYSVFKDRYGLMWFGTSNGLNCYDGLTMKTYNASETRRRNEMYDIAQTDDGTIYAATAGGVFTLDLNGRGRMKRVKESPEERINVVETSGRELYVGCGSGLYIMEDGEVKSHVMLQNDRMSKENTVNDIVVTRDVLWLLGNRDIWRYDRNTGRVQPMNLPKKTRVNGRLRVLALAGKRLFAGSYNEGLVWMDVKGKDCGCYVSVGSNVITDMQVADKQLYVATDGAGVSVVSLATDEIINTYNTQNGLADNSVYSFLRTDSGINWFGYFRRGVSHDYFSSPLFHYFEGNGFSTYGLNVRSFCIDGERKVIGTREGLYYYDGHTSRYYSPGELGGGGIVTSVVKYAGMYYIATFDNGVCRLDPATGRIERFGNNILLETASFGRLAVSPTNELWMASNAGVFVYNVAKNELHNFDSRNSQLFDSYANSLLFDRHGRCWIGTHEGMCVYNPIDGMLRTQGFPENFKSNVPEPNFILALDNNILSYSTEGLYRISEELDDFGPIESNPVISNTLINFVVCDTKAKQYWVGTEHGLFCFDKDFKNYRTYGYSFGMQSSEFSTNAGYIDAGRRMWIGSMNGLVYVNLNELDKLKLQQSRILLTDLTIDGREITAAEEMLMVRDRQISLSYLWGTEEPAFRPVLLNYADQRDIYYEYRIGEDGDWVSVRSGERAVCRGFSFGANTLYLRVAGTNDVTIYDVYVKPSPLFILQLSLIAAFFVVLYFFVRSRKELEKVKEELTEEVEKYKRVRTDEEESRKLFNRLKSYVEKNKVYLDDGLKMSDLASAMECSTVKMSQLLNMYCQQNYYDFINRYRLEEFKSRLQDPKYDNYTLVALSEMCGFKKSSFFSTFKKMEGMTPSEYLKKIGRMRL